MASNENTWRTCVYVEKGGVGKTTTAAHTAVAAATDHDLEVLLIDLAGTQNDLATQFGIEDDIDDLDAPISAVFGDDWDFIRENIPDVVERMVFDTGEDVDLIPADPGLGGADNNLANVPVEERFTKLDAFITDDLANRYDLVLLDLPGKEDNITLNGLFAAGNVIAPLKPGAFEQNQLQSLSADMAELREEHPVSPDLAMVIPTMYDTRTRLSEEFAAKLEDTYPETVAPAKVAKSQAVSNQQNAGRTLFAVPRDKRSQTGQRVVEAYRANTTELLKRLADQ